MYINKIALSDICGLSVSFASAGNYDESLFHSPNNQTISQKTNPIATHGIVTSPNFLASQAGLDVLRRGGTAVDAAIATAATLTVVYPQMCTLGGDNFWLIYNAKTGELKALNTSGRSGEKAIIDFYKGKGFKKIPSRGYYAANTVPGVVSGWDEAYKMSVKELGSKYAWKDLLKTPIELAKEGFPVNTSLEFWSKVNVDPSDKEFRNMQRFPEFARVFLKDGDKPCSVS